MKESDYLENTGIMEDFIPTRCARVKKDSQQNFVSVKYTAHKKKVADNSDQKVTSVKEDRKEDRNESVDPKKQQELEMKRARYDIIKFGMTGFNNVEAHRAKVAAAIALGARPPKNRKTNYKKLKEDRSKAKEAAKKKERISGATKSLAKLRGRKKKNTNKKESGILGVYGKVKKGALKS